MIDAHYKTPVCDQQTNTEINLYDNVNDMAGYMTMNPLDISMTDPFSETQMDESDRTYIYYGLCGILVCLVVCVFCYNCFLCVRDSLRRQETALRETNERLSRLTHRSTPMNQGRIFIEDFHEGQPNALRQRVIEHSHVTNTCHENTDIEAGGMKEIIRITDIDIPSYRSPQEILESRYFPENFPDRLCRNTAMQESENFDLFSYESEICDSVNIDLSWLSEEPLAYSTPADSNERMHNIEGNSNVSRDSYEKGESLKYQTPKVTPEKKYPEKSPFSPKGQTRSSPPTPENVRRRLRTTTENTSRRPSSWR